MFVICLFWGFFAAVFLYCKETWKCFQKFLISRISSYIYPFFAEELYEQLQNQKHLMTSQEFEGNGMLVMVYIYLFNI